MVFDTDPVFQQFLHCKFRDNVVRLLVIPGDSNKGPIFLAVSKWGGVGLYNPQNMGLLHTFCLDMDVHHGLLAHPPRPKCSISHLVVDAVSAEDVRSIFFVTNKGIFQCYDTGSLEEEDLGLGILPRAQFFQLSQGQSPLPPRNHGFVETHRLTGIETVPSCLTYHLGHLLVGAVSGEVLILEVGGQLGGRRKIRGVLHRLNLSDLGHVSSYRAHQAGVQKILALGRDGRKISVLSASRDSKFSLFCQDTSGDRESFIISLPKGVNRVISSSRLNLVVTGSEDGVVRLFSEFSMKMPQMELTGHRGPIVGLALIPVPFHSEAEILLSYSEDVELRAWDPVSFVCLQSVYIRFPVGSATIRAKTPEWGHDPCLLFQDQGSGQDKRREPFIFLIYCNAYAKVGLDLGGSSLGRAWPFNDFDVDALISSKPPKTTPTTTKGVLHPEAITLNGEELEEIEKRALRDMSRLLRYKYQEEAGRKSGSGRIRELGSRQLKCLQNSGDAWKGGVMKGSIFGRLPLYPIPPIPCPNPPKYYLGQPEEEGDEILEEK